MTSEKLLYTKAEAAQALSLSVRGLEYLIASKELAVRRIGRRVLVPSDELSRFANVRSSKATPERINGRSSPPDLEPAAVPDPKPSSGHLTTEERPPASMMSACNVSSARGGR